MYFKDNLPFQGGFSISEMQSILCNFSSQIWRYWGSILTLKREGLWKGWVRLENQAFAWWQGGALDYGLVGAINAPQSGKERSELRLPTQLQSFCQRCRECCRQRQKGSTSSREDGSLLPGEQVSFLPSSQGSHFCQKTCFQKSSLGSRK